MGTYFDQWYWDAQVLNFAVVKDRTKNTPELGAAFKAAWRDAHEEASLVKPKALAKAHPDLPRMFRKTYLKELEIAMLGMASMARNDKQSAELAKEWTELLSKRQEWWEENRFDLDIPEDVPMWDSKRSDIERTTDPEVLKNSPK